MGNVKCSNQKSKERKDVGGSDPTEFLDMVKKAHILIESDRYLEDIERMVGNYIYNSSEEEDGPLEVLVHQLDNRDKAIVFCRHQDRLLSLIKMLLHVAESPSSRTRCLLMLIINTNPRQDHFKWTNQFIEILKSLLHKGADPTWIAENHSESALFYIFKNIAYVIAMESQLFCAVMELITLLLTEQCLSYQTRIGSILHALVIYCWSRIEGHLPTQFFEQYQQIIKTVVEARPGLVDSVSVAQNNRSPLLCFVDEVAMHRDAYDEVGSIMMLLISDTNISTQDENGENILHIVARSVFYDVDFGPGVLPVLSCLSTNENVNATDEYSVTPYSWILGGMLRSKDSPEAKNTLAEIADIFMRNGADYDLAKAGLPSVLFAWLGNDLSDPKYTSQQLKTLLNSITPVDDWISQSFHGNLISTSALDNINAPRNPEYLHTINHIVEALLTNTHCAPNLRNALIYRSPLDPGLSWMEILYNCFEHGGRPSELQVKKVTSYIRYVRMKDELAKPYLKILISVSQYECPTIDLDFLVNWYVIWDDVRQLVIQLTNSIYKSLESSLESGKLIVCLLCLSITQDTPKKLKSSWVRSSVPDNWLKRNALHLAAIFLNSESSFKRLPKKIITMYIQAKDLHGCTPLHVAHLHHNKAAVDFLVSHGAKQEVTDNFGMTPKSLGTRVGVISINGRLETEHYQEHEYCTLTEEHMDVQYFRHCINVMEAQSGVLEKLRPMLLLPENEATDIIEELMELFRRLVLRTKFRKALTGIVLAGSLRERLKVGRLDEADIQIRLDIKKGKGAFTRDLNSSLIRSFSKISWDGIYMRPVFIRKSPWKFIREGPSSCQGLTISVDVVPILTQDEERLDLHECQVKILEGAPIHKKMMYVSLEFLFPFPDKSVYRTTPFAFEWDIIDSLPPGCRLAIAIAKALVQAYDMWKGVSTRIKMPVTSYMLKNALFFILAGDNEEFVLPRELPMVNAMKKVFGTEETLDGRGIQNTTLKNKLKFNPNPKWMNDKDLHDYAEEASEIARKIFTLIKCLVEQGYKLDSYWKEKGVDRVVDKMGYGEAEYILDVCNCLLQRLENGVF